MDRRLPIAAILALASVLRLYDLGKPPLFFDESIHSVFVNAVLSQTYHYDPAYHGPFLFYSLASVVALLGESEFSLRLLPALLGVAVVIVVYAYRRYIGERAALISAFLVAISPVIVNYSRFCRADVYQMLFTALFVYFIFRYLEHGENGSWKEWKIDRRSFNLIAAFVSLSLFACVKETFYPFAAIFALFFLFDIRKVRVTDLVLSASIFLAIYLTFYTNFWQDLSPVSNFSKFPAVRAIDYWKHQHEIARIAGPWYYYLEILLLYDFPALLLAAVSVLMFKDEKSSFQAFLIYWFIASLAFFSYMQEKVPWLAVHIELPMFILAGITLSRIRKSYMILAATSIYLLHGCLALNIVNPVNPAEPAAYMPTQYDVREIVAEFNKTDRIYVFTTVGEYWPLAWYLKGYKVYYYTRGIDNVDLSGADVIIANSTNAAKIGDVGSIASWSAKTMVVRCWSFWTTPDVGKIPEFILFRKPFASVDCMNFTVFRTH